MKYKFLEHTGDIKFQAYGKTINEAFQNVVSAISNFLARGKRVKSIKKKKVEVKGHDKESLLYDFIEEIIYLFDAENFVVSKAKVKITENTLKAELLGDNASNYKDLDQIKAATYHDMHIKKTKSGWEVQVVLDV